MFGIQTINIMAAEFHRPGVDRAGTKGGLALLYHCEEGHVHVLAAVVNTPETVATVREQALALVEGVKALGPVPHETLGKFQVDFMPTLPDALKDAMTAYGVPDSLTIDAGTPPLSGLPPKLLS